MVLPICFLRAGLSYVLHFHRPRSARLQVVSRCAKATLQGGLVPLCLYALVSHLFSMPGETRLVLCGEGAFE